MTNRVRAVRALVFASGAFGLLMTTGCLNGAIYRHTTQPLDIDFENTPVHDGGRGESWKRLVIPIFYRNQTLEFDWGDMSIARALEEADIDVVHYADIETRQILGVWTERWVHVYGETAPRDD